MSTRDNKREETRPGYVLGLAFLGMNKLFAIGRTGGGGGLPAADELLDPGRFCPACGASRPGGLYIVVVIGVASGWGDSAFGAASGRGGAVGGGCEAEAGA